MTVQLARSCCLSGHIQHRTLVSSCLGVLLESYRHYGRDKSSALQNVRSLPPAAPQQPCVKEAHGVKWNDPYLWMSNPSQKAFLVEHLHQENKYADMVMADTLQLQQTLMREMASRMGSELSVPPERWGSWWYYSKVPEGEEFPVYYRRPEEGFDLEAHSFGSQEQVLLDQNAIAEQYGYVHVGMCKLSANHNLLAYTIDKKGTEEFTLFVKDLCTGELLSQHTTEGVVSVEWAQTEPSLFYTVVDNLMRPSKIYCRSLDSTTESNWVLEEHDPSRFVDVARTKDWQFITLNVNTKTSSEVHLVDAKNPGGRIQRVEHRRSNVEYYVEHHGGFLYILTNLGPSPNYRLVRCPIQTSNSEFWEEVIGAEDGVVITDMDVFHKHLVLYERRAGLPCIRVLDLPLSTNPDTRKRRELLLPQKVCSIHPGANQDFFSTSIRLAVNSPVMPEAIFDYSLITGNAKLLQQNQPHLQKPPVLASGHQVGQVNRSTPIGSVFQEQAKQYGHEDLFDLSSLYTCEQMMVTSSDGVQVPLTVVHSRNMVKNGTAPALLFGYGAYGQMLETEWCSDRLSLLDRGWVLAFAHVRGGGELGRTWHHRGRLMNKRNSFQDFHACANYMVDHKYAHHSKLAAWGMSAGGLLASATLCMYPSLFCTAILEVPFVDICNTMLDPSLPLTIPEYEEWGNPEDLDCFKNIRSYSPYDTIREETNYPAMLVTSSLHDTRVGYWEAPKWVAKIRDCSSKNKNTKHILLKTSMISGHFGEGGRYQHLKTTALQYAFLMKNRLIVSIRILSRILTSRWAPRSSCLYTNLQKYTIEVHIQVG